MKDRHMTKQKARFATTHQCNMIIEIIIEMIISDRLLWDRSMDLSHSVCPLEHVLVSWRFFGL